MNGTNSERMSIARQSASASLTVTIGTGLRRPMLGQENQRNIGLLSPVPIEEADVGPGEPALHDLGLQEWRPQADDCHRKHHAHKQPAGLRASPVLQQAFGLHDEPGRTEKPVAQNKTDCRQNAERRQPVKGTAREEAALHPKTLNESTEHETLCQRRDERAVMKGRIPSVARTGRSLEAQLEGNAPEDQGHQHDKNRKIEGRQNDAEGEGEGSEEGNPAQDEPSFAPIWDGNETWLVLG